MGTKVVGKLKRSKVSLMVASIQKMHPPGKDPLLLINCEPDERLVAVLHFVKLGVVDGG